MAIADLLMQSMPLGFRFRPSDFELIDHYLKGKICGRLKSEDDVIAVIDICKCEPWDLPGKSLLQLNDLEWFFFAPKDRKYPGTQRSNRATKAGYWKATGKDRLIKSRLPRQGSVVIGTKKTLVFHLGRAPRGKGTCWIMHEYRTTEPEFESGKEGGFVLCRLFKKIEESIIASDNNECTESYVDEMMSSDVSVAIPTMCVPDEVPDGEDALKFAQPMNQRFPKQERDGSEVALMFAQPPVQNYPEQEGSQSLPLAAYINSPEVNSSEVDIDCVTSYLSKPVEGSCSDTVLSDTVDHETDLAGTEVEHLLGDIGYNIDQYYNGFSHANFHRVHSFNNPDFDCSLFDGFEEGSKQNLLQNCTTEEISVEDFLESFASEPDQCFPKGYPDYDNSIISCLQDVTDESSLDSVLGEESKAGSIGNIEAASAQDIVSLVDEGLPTFSSSSSQTNNYSCHVTESYSQLAVLPKEHLSRRVSFGRNVDSLHQEHDITSKEARPGKFTVLPNDVGSETIQDSSLAGIQVRSHQVLTNMEYCVPQQGSAMRRLRLRKFREPSSGQEETVERNAHKSTDSEALKILNKQKKSVPEYDSSISNAITCTTEVRDNLAASSTGWNSITRLAVLVLAILVALVASWYLIR